jgi:hypothetical protein
VNRRGIQKKINQKPLTAELAEKIQRTQSRAMLGLAAVEVPYPH